MQNVLRPSIRQPASVRVAIVPGRVEILPGLADGGGQHDAVAGDPRQRGGEAARASLCPGRDGDLATALHVEHRDEVHVHADRDRGVAARQPARRHHEVVRGRHAEPTELDRDGRREIAGGLERVDRLERVAAVPVVLGGAGDRLLGELLGDGHQARAGLGAGGQFDHSLVTSRATGTPLVTMS